MTPTFGIWSSRQVSLRAAFNNLLDQSISSYAKMNHFSPISRPKNVRPQVRRSADDYSSKAAPKHAGVGAKKPSAPRASGVGGKVIDSNRRGVGGAGGRRVPGAPSGAAVGGPRKPAGRDKVRKSVSCSAWILPELLRERNILLV